MLTIRGDIKTLFQICEQFLPEILIPTAPIHTMADLIPLFLANRIEEVTESKFISDHEASLRQSAPPTLNIRSRNETIYLSYAPWDKLCPLDCPGPKKYCSHHHIDKPLTATEVVEQSFPKESLFLFESQQISPGLGGIPGTAIKKALLKIHNVQNGLDYCIATTCNCHGVLDFLKITNK